MKRLLGLAPALALVSTVAFAQDVSYNYDQQADFTKYKTYKWVQVKGAEQQVSDLVAKQLTDAFDKHLALKGLTKAGGDDADLLAGSWESAGRSRRCPGLSSPKFRRKPSAN